MKKLMVLVMVLVFVVLVVKCNMVLHDRDMRLIEAYQVCVENGECR